jgi:hypothetical protein
VLMRRGVRHLIISLKLLIFYLILITLADLSAVVSGIHPFKLNS